MSNLKAKIKKDLLKNIAVKVKTCPVCLITKSRKEFYTRVTVPDGLQSYCISCITQYKKTRNKFSRENVNKHWVFYMKTHPEARIRKSKRKKIHREENLLAYLMYDQIKYLYNKEQKCLH